MIDKSVEFYTFLDYAAKNLDLINYLYQIADIYK